MGLWCEVYDKLHGAPDLVNLNIWDKNYSRDQPLWLMVNLFLFATDSTKFSSLFHALSVYNILCTRKISKNLLSISQFTRDNACYFEFYPNYFIVKDIQMQQELLRCPVKDGLYSLCLSINPAHCPQVTLSISISNLLWH